MLQQTLDSICAQAFDGLEVVICDDCSRDDTVSVAQEYARRYPYIRVFRNEKNLGMDRNFVQTVLRAAGTFVWFSGQDDVFNPGALAKFREIVAQHPDVDVIYFNYRFLSGDLSQEVAEPLIKLQKDAYLSSAQDYFRAVDHAPTFLAATAMRRSLWDKTPYERFYDTHYVQMAVVLHNLSTARVYVVADPRYVVCRIPEDSWKHRGGQMLFEIFTGSLEVYHTVFADPANPVPSDLFRDKRRRFLYNLPIYVVSFGERGFRLTPMLEARMRRMFGSNPLLYWLYVWPLIHLPPRVQSLLLRMHRWSGTRWIIRTAGRLLIRIGSRGA
jgi:glycosyltransferase involved in cell wall biosynthesis